jgi:hypothetical protein
MSALLQEKVGRLPENNRLGPIEILDKCIQALDISIKKLWGALYEFDYLDDKNDNLLGVIILMRLGLFNDPPYNPKLVSVLRSVLEDLKSIGNNEDLAFDLIDRLETVLDISSPFSELFGILAEMDLPDEL